MRLLSRCLCLLALVACAPLAHAQIHHCVGAHGEPVYSGQPCGTPRAANARGGLGGVCASSPQALQHSIRQAFAGHDVNRLAGLMLWRGMDQASARAALHSLAGWLEQALVGIAVAYPNGPPDAIGSTTTARAGRSGMTAATPIGFTVSTSGGARHFGVIESSGCWWLIFQGSTCGEMDGTC